MKDWKDYIKLPLRPDTGGYCSYIWCNNKYDQNQMIFDCIIPEHSGEDYDYWVAYFRTIVDKINEDETIKYRSDIQSKKILDTTFTCDGTFIYADGKEILEIRGWGYLSTEMGSENAIDVQQEFINYCCDKLNL